jgi:nitrilase
MIEGSTMTEYFKLAAIQAAPVMFDRDASTEKACRLIREAGAMGATVAGTPERYRELSTFEHTGDSTIIDPRGEIIAGPAQGETILIAEGSREAVLAAKAMSDIGGHYSRPDLLRVIVDRRPQTRMAERGLAPDEETQAG